MKITWMRGRWREELPGTAARWLLLPLWLIFRPLVYARNKAFDYGWRAIYRLPVPVWSVGNITAGGTGKTPLTRFLATWAQQHNLHPAIVTRGYGGDESGSNDEAKTVRECPVICNPDRVAGGQHAISSGAQCLILDDGFQHRRLHRDLDIVMIDATKPWGSSDSSAGCTLPLGYLRESRSALQRAHVIAISRSTLISEKDLADLHKQLAIFNKPLIHVIDEEALVSPLFKQENGSPTTALIQQSLLLVSGLGNPLGFEKAAKNYGWLIAESLRYPDHYHFTQADVAHVLHYAQQLQARVVMTEKDAVKWRPLVSAEQAENIMVLTTRSGIAQKDHAVLEELLRKTLTTAKPAQHAAH